MKSSQPSSPEKKSSSVAPKFTKVPANHEAQDGDRVPFECRVTGMPKPTIKWFKDGKVLKSNADFKQTFTDSVAKLVIAEVLPEDSGKYECVATNSAGEERVSCKLEVKGQLHK